MICICNEEVDDLHDDCVLRAQMGGIGHVTDHEHWCVRRHDPDMGLSYRESARRVVVWVKANGWQAAERAAKSTIGLRAAIRAVGILDEGMVP